MLKSGLRSKIFCHNLTNTRKKAPKIIMKEPIKPGRPHSCAGNSRCSYCTQSGRRYVSIRDIMSRGYNVGWYLVVIFSNFWFVFAKFVLVHDAEVIFLLPYVPTASGNLFRTMSARKTTKCSFTGITHISEKIFRCCKQLT